jgi:hypothetical protein
MDPQQGVHLCGFEVDEQAIGPTGYAKAATGYIAGFSLVVLNVFIESSLKGNSHPAIELFFSEPEGIVYPKELGYNKSCQ